MDRVTYHRLARRELNEAAQYYESESPGLGAAFLDEVERCTQAIANFPEAGPLITETIRRRLPSSISLRASLFHQTRQGAGACGHEPEAPTDVLGWPGVTGKAKEEIGVREQLRRKKKLAGKSGGN